jgi:hypothetical protein
MVGALLALGGGVWFIIGPAISLLWAANAGGLVHVGVGAPIGGHAHAAAEAIGLFYGLGALVTVLAVFAIARLAWRPGLREGPAVASDSRAIRPAPAATPATRVESPSRIREGEPAVR